MIEHRNQPEEFMVYGLDKNSWQLAKDGLATMQEAESWAKGLIQNKHFSKIQIVISVRILAKEIKA